MNTHQHEPLLIPVRANACPSLVATSQDGQPRLALVPAGPIDHPAPMVDDDGLLRFRNQWVALTEMQVPIVHLLIASLGRMVSIDELRATYARAGGSADGAALRTLMHRVGRRLTQIGASVTYARHRSGMMVTVPSVPAEASS